MGDLQDHILDAMRSEGRSLADVERAADAAGVPHGQKATTSQRAAILARLYGWSVELPAAPSPEELLASVLEVTGGELVEAEPPKPGTDAYKALPSGTERSQAKAYWDAKRDAEPESLAEQLRVETPA